MDLRFKFCWLVLSFKADTKDDDRLGVPVDHVNFYFQRYYSKPLQLKDYGVKELDEIYVLIKDAVKVEDGVLTSQLADDLDCDIFVKMTEEGQEYLKMKVLQDMQKEGRFGRSSSKEMSSAEFLSKF